MFIKHLFASIVAAVALGAPAVSVQSADIDACTQADEPLAAVDGCTRFLNRHAFNTEQAAMALNNRANAHSMLGDDDAALVDYDRAIDIVPTYINARYNRAHLLLGQEKYALALVDLDIVVQLSPSMFEAHHNRGFINEKLGRYAEAEADFTKAISLAPHLTSAWNNRGVVFKRLGKYALAITDFTEAIRLAPDSIRAYLNRADACEKIGQHAKALADYRRVLLLDPANELAQASIGRHASSQ